jgi:hypothetical protein
LYHKYKQVGGNTIKLIFENSTLNHEKPARINVVLVDDISYLIKNKFLSAPEHEKLLISPISTNNDLKFKQENFCPYIPPNLGELSWAISNEQIT